MRSHQSYSHCWSEGNRRHDQSPVVQRQNVRLVNGRSHLDRDPGGPQQAGFGLSRRPGDRPSSPGLTWQFGMSDVDAVITACEQADLAFEVIMERPRED